jgi:hypothetical protein
MMRELGNFARATNRLFAALGAVVFHPLERAVTALDHTFGKHPVLAALTIAAAVLVVAAVCVVAVVQP